MRKIAARATDVTSFVTTDYVLDEAVTLTRFAHSHSKAVELAEASLSSRFIRLVYCDQELFSDGMKVFKQHSDKEWSLTDCVSFATMKKHGVGRVHVRRTFQTSRIRDSALAVVEPLVIQGELGAPSLAPSES